MFQTKQLFSTNIHDYLNFYYFAIHAFYSNFLIAFVLPVKDCSMGSRKLVVLKVIPLKLFYYQTFFETWRN